VAVEAATWRVRLRFVCLRVLFVSGFEGAVTGGLRGRDIAGEFQREPSLSSLHFHVHGSSLP
jgi:hypothetical protein